MSYTYDKTRRYQGQQTPAPEQTTAPGPSMEALMSGQAMPSAAQKGQPFDLDAAMKAKMENAFGDLSSVKFYKSQAVGDAGAAAVARGNEIAFAPGMADFSTREGQERLGHELSHVMSQRSGQVRGSGFLADSSLEARADREGAMAAAGQQVFSGPVTQTLSDAGPSPMAAGVMQASRNWGRGGNKTEKKTVKHDLIGEKTEWGDVKWGIGDKLKHWWNTPGNKLDYSNDREDILKREATEMAMTADDAFNDSVYLPNEEEGETPDLGYNFTDDPLDLTLKRKNRSKPAMHEVYDLNDLFYPEKKEKKKWYQFWK